MGEGGAEILPSPFFSVEGHRKAAARLSAGSAGCFADFVSAANWADWAPRRPFELRSSTAGLFVSSCRRRFFGVVGTSVPSARGSPLSLRALRRAALRFCDLLRRGDFASGTNVLVLSCFKYSI